MTPEEHDAICRQVLNNEELGIFDVIPIDDRRKYIAVLTYMVINMELTGKSSVLTCVSKPVSYIKNLLREVCFENGYVCSIEDNMVSIKGYGSIILIASNNRHIQTFGASDDILITI